MDDTLANTHEYTYISLSITDEQYLRTLFLTNTPYIHT